MSDGIYRIDTADEYYNGAYDDDGNDVVCDFCGGEMKFRDGEWYCTECGQTMDRATYFNHIGAEPPGDGCMHGCDENYPLCKKWCSRYEIDPDDPILD